MCNINLTALQIKSIQKEHIAKSPDSYVEVFDCCKYCNRAYSYFVNKLTNKSSLKVCNACVSEIKFTDEMLKITYNALMML